MIVVDCSVLIASLLPDEIEEQAQLIMVDLQRGVTLAVVPCVLT